MEKFETKHTPGPWVYANENKLIFSKNDQQCVAIATRTPLNWEAKLYEEHEGRIAFKNDGPETEANSYLIAAAPLLLSALIQAVEAFEMYKRINPQHYRTEDRLPEWYCEAKAAIQAAISQPENVKQ